MEIRECARILVVGCRPRCSRCSRSQTLFRNAFGETLFRGGAWWLTTAEGLFRFPPVRRARELTTSRPTASFTVGKGLLDNALDPVYLDSNGDLWFAAWSARTGAHALYHWESATDAVRNVSTANAPSLNRKTINAFAEDRSGRLWIGFKEGGLVRGRSASFDELPHHPTEPVQGLYFDGAGRLWISSLENGVIRVDDPASDQPRFRSAGGRNMS